MALDTCSLMGNTGNCNCILKLQLQYCAKKNHIVINFIQQSLKEDSLVIEAMINLSNGPARSSNIEILIQTHQINTKTTLCIVLQCTMHIFMPCNFQIK